MWRARTSGDAPPGGSGRRHGRTCGRHQEGRRALCLRGKSEPASRGQGNAVETADDDRRGSRPQTLLHRPQAVGRRCSFDQQEIRRIDAEGRKARPVKTTDLARHPRRPAPDHQARMGRSGTSRTQTAGCQQKCKSQSSGACGIRLGSDLAEAGEIQSTVRQPTVDLGSTERPIGVRGIGFRSIIDAGGIVYPLASLEGCQLGAQPSQFPLPPPPGWGIWPLRGRRG